MCSNKIKYFITAYRSTIHLNQTIAIEIIKTMFILNILRNGEKYETQFNSLKYYEMKFSNKST